MTTDKDPKKDADELDKHIIQNPDADKYIVLPNTPRPPVVPETPRPDPPKKP